MSLIVPFSIFNNINLGTYYLDVSGEVNDLVRYYNNEGSLNFITVGSLSSVNSQSVSSIAFIDYKYQLDTSFLNVSSNYNLQKIIRKNNEEYITFRNNSMYTTDTIFNINTQTKQISSLTHPMLTNSIYTIENGTSDKLIIGSSFNSVGSTTRNSLACLSGNGTTLGLDNIFRGGIRRNSSDSGSVYKIKFDTTYSLTFDETIIVAGSFNQVNSISPTTWVNRNNIIRLSKSTGYFTGLTFNAVMDSTNTVLDFDINNIDINDPSYGNIVIAFTSVHLGNRGITVIQPDGSVDSSFSHNIPDLSFYCSKCIFSRVGSSAKKIIVCVISFTANVAKIYRLHSTGKVDTTFNSPKGYIQVYGYGNLQNHVKFLYESHYNGDIIIGGSITGVENKSRNGMAVIDVYGNVR